eukprot:TRINITY_DN3359_c0_g1_i3.p1 TRINITY_DN3359_c0_g1~~TRINITY_DN3359_c0_g1_i3.p1  ORF type:complete len:429 (+),score=63.24 TRINITY_DN3359_c0_g1_i3:184-1470(+)
MNNNLRKWINFGLFFTIGLTSWLLTNAMFLEIPIFIRRLPEHYNIASYLVISTQVGNVVGLVHFILRSHFSKLLPKYSLLVTLIFAMCVALCTSFFWEHTIKYGDEEWSIALLVLCGLSGAVGSLSVVIMIPFAAIHGTWLTSAIASGMGSNGIVASLVSLAQQPQNDVPVFDVNIFFFVMFGIICLSLISALIIIIFPNLTEEYLLAQNGEITTVEQTQDGESPESPSKSAHVDSHSSLIDRRESHFEMIEVQHLPSSFHLAKKVKMAFLSEGYISILNYSLVGITPYLTVGFSDDVKNSLIFWSTWGYVALGAAGRLITAKVYFYNITFFIFSQIVLWIYLMGICFVQQRHEISEVWGWISVICYSLYSFLYGFVDTINYHKIAKDLKDEPHLIEKSSSLIGVSNQFGAIVGSFLGFSLALKVFHT